MADTPPRARPGARRIATRYLPVVAVLAVIAIVVAIIGSSGGGGSHPAPTRHGALPLTFDEAQSRGVTVNWGPSCDTSTGRVAVPFSYAPPCVQPPQGPNGGATAPGVTADTINVVLYQQQPDVLQQAFLQQTGSDASLAAEARTTQAYVDFFQAHYQTYGRKVHLITFRATGSPDDDVAAKADAITVATQLHAFASFGGPSLTSAYADELAARHVLCLGDCTLAVSTAFVAGRAPYVWPTLATPEQASQQWAPFVYQQLNGRPAVHAGDPALRRRTRTFGVVHFDDGTGIFDEAYNRFAGLLKQHHTKITVNLKYQLDLTQAQENARNLIASLKRAHVTTVVMATDPLTPEFLTKEATAQGYFPEWVVLGYAYSDTAVFARTYDQRQWAHAFGVTLLPARTADSVDEFASILRWQSGHGPEAKTFRVLVQAPLIFFTGVHLAGPNLNAQTFRDGLFRYPANRPLIPTALHTSWGRHGIWPGTDYTWGDDASIIWWDPNISGPDEVGDQGRGLFRYALEGRRYLPGHLGTDVGLYDTARSATVDTVLPPEARTKNYPSPARSSTSTSTP
jgi:hypothetical protein